MLPALSLLVALFGPPGSAMAGAEEGDAASESAAESGAEADAGAEASAAGVDTATPDDAVTVEGEDEAEGEGPVAAALSGVEADREPAATGEQDEAEWAPGIKVRRGPAVSWSYEPGKLRRRPQLEVEAAAERTVRGEIWYTQALDGSTSVFWRAPARLRGRVRAHIGRFGAGLDLQDARVVNAPTRAAVRSGMHQLFFDFEQPTGPGSIAVRVGRQEILDGSGHMLWHAPWGAGMRSWDAIDMRLDLGRGFWLRAFGGSLARPLLGSSVGLADQLRLHRELGWMGQAGWAGDQVAVELAVIGRHVEIVEPAERREHYTPQLRVSGAFGRGFAYELEGRAQFGSVQGREQLAGAGFGRLRYLSPEGDLPGKLRLGGQLGFDVASGGPCTEVEPAAAGPCGPGKVHDFDSSWRARHRWFGHADRFAPSNVGDLFVGLRLKTQPFSGHSLGVSLVNHVFTLVDPRGRWLAPGGALVGVDPNNRERGLADEIDLEARWTWGVISVSAGWLVVANLAGGRALSGERWRHMTYGWLEFKY